VSSSIGSHSLTLPDRLLELGILKEVESDVTAKTATPTKVDSKLTDAQLESLKRATKALEGTWGRKGKPRRPED
jgi:hypothetical protein